MSENRIDPTAAPKPVSPTGTPVLPPAAVPYIAIAVALIGAVPVALASAGVAVPAWLIVSSTVITSLGAALGVASPGMRKQPEGDTMNATNSRNRALDGEFIATLAATLCLVGQDVVAESGATPQHAERLAYALKCFSDAEGQAKKLGFAIATVTAIQNAVSPVPDATMKSVVAGAWNILMQVP